jgi:hypothetical protein
MRTFNRLCISIFLLLLFTPAPLNAGGLPAKTLKDLKAASVYIKCDVRSVFGPAKTIPITGSGFLLHVAGDAGFIATNSHVLPQLGETPLGNPRVVFHSGTPNERTVEAQIVANDPLRDLAILKVTGCKHLPCPIPMASGIEVVETMPVYVFGFPFGKDLAWGRSNPAITITKGTVSSLRHDDRGDVQLVQIDAEINPGNSGGPIVDEKGHLIGVAVAKLAQVRTIGFAVPLKPLAEMMQGKVATVAFDTHWVVKDHAEVSVEAGLIDPLGKLRDATIYYRLIKDTKDLPSPNKDGKLSLLKEVSQVYLKMSPGKGRGRFTLKGAEADKVIIAYQVSCATAAGKTVVSPLSFAAIDFTKVVWSERLTWNDPKGPNGKPRKLYTHPMKAGKHYVLNMRADPKDLGPRLIVQDASGKVLADDDGSGGRFDALIVFSPRRDDEYHIVATASEGAGPFWLIIREESGREVGPGGLTVPGVLRSSDPIDPVMLSQHQSFNLILKKGKHYTVDIKSDDFDPCLRLDNMAGQTVKNEDMGGIGHSTLVFSPSQDGIYRLVATAFDFKVGRFDLTVRATAGPKPYKVGPDGFKVASLLTANDLIDSVNGKAGKKRCKVFAVTLKASQKYQIDLISKQFDTILRIEDSDGRELARDDDWGNLNKRLIFTPPDDGVYRVIATHGDGRFGAFDLVVRPIP